MTLLASFGTYRIRRMVESTSVEAGAEGALAVDLVAMLGARRGAASSAELQIICKQTALTEEEEEVLQDQDQEEEEVVALERGITGLVMVEEEVPAMLEAGTTITTIISMPFMAITPHSSLTCLSLITQRI